jgi:hypothetical protein
LISTRERFHRLATEDVLLQLIAQGELFSGDEAVVALADRLDAKEAQATANGVGGDSPATGEVCHGRKGFSF